MKNKNFHSTEQRIECLESLIDKLLEQLTDSQIIQTNNSKENNYVITIDEDENYFSTRWNGQWN